MKQAEHEVTEHEASVYSFGDLTAAENYLSTRGNILPVVPPPLERMVAGAAGGFAIGDSFRSVYRLSNEIMFRNPQYDYGREEESWDFRLLQLPMLLALPNMLDTLEPVLLQTDLLVLQPDYSWVLNPSVPVEASSMVRLAGSRVPLTQANQLVAVSAAARPTSTRPVNMLLYFRGLAHAQTLAEIEAVSSMPRQNAATPHGGQRLYRGAAAAPPVPAGGTVGPNTSPGTLPALDGFTVLRVTSD